MTDEKHYGWICPKCGCPNAPTNKTCVSCYSILSLSKEVKYPEYTPLQPWYDPTKYYSATMTCKTAQSPLK